MRARDTTRGHYAPTPDTALTAVQAAAATDPASRTAGFQALVAAYWKPVYKLLRIHWHADPATAEDLTQGFFTSLLERGDLATYDPARGRFRTWLRACLDHYVLNHRQTQRRLKRGGGRQPLTLDFAAADREITAHPADPALAADALFDQELIRELFRAAILDLQETLLAAGHERRLEIFTRYDLVDDPARPTYAQLAAELHTTTTQITNELAAARRKLRQILLARLRAISGDDAEFRAEARRLLGASP